MDNYSENINPNTGAGSNYSDMSNMSYFDLLANVPLEKCFPELLRRGIKTAKDIKDTASKVCDNMVEEEYAKMCMPELTLKFCTDWLKTNRGAYPQAAYFFIYLEDNATPRNENDRFSVALALLDGAKKPIYMNQGKAKLFPTAKNSDIVCQVIPAGNIDTRLINALNGNESVLIKL